MKIKFLLLVIGLYSTIFSLTSCLKTDDTEIVYSSNTSITGFSLGTLNIERVGTAQDGSDSIYTDTINCSIYPFTIDQMSRTIENKDSLPVGTDVTKVALNITADSDYIFYTKNNGTSSVDTLWTTSDSIDFTKPVTFKVMAYSGAVGKPYTVKVNVHQQVPDSLQWAFIDNSFDQGIQLTRQKAVYAGDRIYVFGQNSSGQTIIQWSGIGNGTPTSWHTLAAITDSSEIDGIDSYSATAWNDAVYFVANQQLYAIDPSTNQCTAIQTPVQLSQLIVGSTKTGRLYAFDAQQQSGYLNEAYEWTTDASANALSSFAGNRISAAAYPVSYNQELERLVALSSNNGTNEADTVALVANRLSNEEAWSVYTPNHPVVCPNLANISMIYYDEKFFAFGGSDAEETVAPFAYLYCSIDNGLSWTKKTEETVFPQKESSANPNLKPFNHYYTEGEGTYSCAVDEENFIWIIWEDGSLCRGRINRLGFASKW